MEDDAIIELFFTRDEAALAECKRKFGSRLYRTAMNILHNNEDAEECMSDAMLRAWAAIPPARPERLGAFMAKIVRNLSLNKWEARGAAKRGGNEATVMLGELEEWLPAEGTGPEAEFEAAQVTRAINDFLCTLDDEAKTTFVMRYFHGESVRAVGDRFRMSESKVKSLLFRTRKKLKVYLEKEGVII